MSRPAQRRLSTKEEVRAAAAKTDLSPSKTATVLPDATGPPTLAEDLLYGAAAIAEFMFGNKEERRKVYGLIESGALPVFRLGAILCARKSTIVRDVEARERAAVSEIT
jgi:hypothetical protein